jgi:hypothetical protein
LASFWHLLEDFCYLKTAFLKAKEVGAAAAAVPEPEILFFLF